MAKFGFGDVVRIREEETLARVVCEIQDEDGSIWYEVEAVGIEAPYTREVREEHLKLA